MMEWSMASLGYVASMGWLEIGAHIAAIVAALAGVIQLWITGRGKNG